MSTTNTPDRAISRTLPPLMRLTEAAVERLQSLYTRGEAGKMLRIGINTKGCSGMSYQMDWVETKSPTDESVTEQGITVLIDRKATLFLIGTVMDYKSDKFTSGFTFENPNEKGRCGCGESFHV
ncbi:HesB/IscA family protein [Acidiphilium acidophilum]|uniref:Iron-sulfur cluster assembly accessory protein n=1 Tax=Acidiphilium acidophilum TaxID=76588 RepID=A0AAW9DRN4_ACIAO|nr:iron-sulfur cluster assembly accessory protein [Acidiphilium acidophilum]MDX5931307.1 iron-sulfur cluster assembly accessory protein [Acidiphilium acidophilum]MEE3502094.1 iron-sulfur cluster assembly accessory protein [Acidiphilium acidophilum]